MATRKLRFITNSEEDTLCLITLVVKDVYEYLVDASLSRNCWFEVNN